MTAKGITALYALLLIIIIVLAGHQDYYRLFSPIRALPAGDKVGHFLLMGMFSFLVNRSLRCRTVTVFSRRLLLGSVVVFLAVTAEEFSQIPLRHRTFDLIDLFFDGTGIWLFGKLAFLFQPRVVRE